MALLLEPNALPQVRLVSATPVSTHKSLFGIVFLLSPSPKRQTPCTPYGSITRTQGMPLLAQMLDDAISSLLGSLSPNMMLWAVPPDPFLVAEQILRGDLRL